MHRTRDGGDVEAKVVRAIDVDVEPNFRLRVAEAGFDLNGARDLASRSHDLVCDRLQLTNVGPSIGYLNRLNRAAQPFARQHGRRDAVHGADDLPSAGHHDLLALVALVAAHELHVRVAARDAAGDTGADGRVRVRDAGQRV